MIAPLRRLANSLRYCPTLLLPLLCSCDPAPPAAPAPPRQAIASVRYQELDRTLRAELVLRPADTLAGAPAPTFMGSAMLFPPSGDRSRYLGQRTIDFPDELRLTVPRGPEHPPTEITYRLARPFVDSLPPTLSATTGARFPALTAPLDSAQHLIFFLEPADRSQRPHRILLDGPTRSTTVFLADEALASVPPGDYTAYLIRQQLDRGEQDGVTYSIQTEYFTRSKQLTIRE